jgi:ABC-2 type transport system permease protein
MDEARFDQYRRYIPDLKMDYVYYYDTSDNAELYKDNPGLSLTALARKKAYVEGIDFREVLNPARIRRQINLRPEENRLVRFLSYGDRKTALRYYDDMMTFASEKEFNAALKRLVEPEKIPRIGFLTGNGERINARAGDADYKTVTQELGFRYSLINQGFDVDTVSTTSLTSLTTNPRTLDTSLTTLVIADPKTAFADSDLAKIKQYISAGGNLIIAGEPGRQALLNPIVQDLGLTFTGDRLICKSQDFAPDFVLAKFSPAGDAFGQNASLRKEHGIVSMPGATSIAPLPGSAGIAPLPATGIASAPSTGIASAPSTGIASAPATGIASTPTTSFHTLPLLVSDSNTLAVAMTRKIGPKEQRIIIIGDADFMSTAEMQRHSPQTNNFDFITELFSWLDNGEFPVDATRPKTSDAININRDGISLVRIVFFCILPLLLLAGGTILLITRKRR